ncbi:hypothetical protein [Lentibacillus sp. CBA3610]|uniref:hypothetical protein n=1 Tax=Lentibacillus sp. CBA3610 TaxID=2518176 RepID=UPI001595FBDE|nr:hypothetical protein [Lentibacillus sp. CBA3610]
MSRSQRVIAVAAIVWPLLARFDAGVARFDADVARFDADVARFDAGVARFMHCRKLSA